MKTQRLFTPFLTAGCLFGAVLGCAAVLAAARLQPESAPAGTAAATATSLRVNEAGRLRAATPAAAGPCKLAHRPSRPLDTVKLFVSTAVARRNTGLSYDLAAPAMRAGFSCSQWRSGAIPVIPIEAIDWSPGIPYRVVDTSPGRVSMVLAIVSRAPVANRYLFRITAVQQSGRWYVSYFMSAQRLYAPPTSGTDS